MPANYIMVSVSCPDNIAEILIAVMSDMGYDSFVNQETGFQASVSADKFDRNNLEKLFHQYRELGAIRFDTEELADQNWNILWEKNYEPVVIGDRCIIRASFHQTEKSYPMEIVINPKMSFGTGHHETTRLMVETQLQTVHQGKSVLDVGCGTGILSILAEKMGADKILGLDTDSWAYENALENIRMNDCKNVSIIQSGIEYLDEISSFDIILANINRHIILQDTGRYAALLKEGGLLICSGFFESDRDLIINEALKYFLVYLSGRMMDKWAVLVFEKKIIKF